MVYDTIRQKFIYNTPFDDKEFPKVTLDETATFKNPYSINATYLYSLEIDDFENVVDTIRANNDSVIIVNDYRLKSRNEALSDGIRCHMLAFAYLFKERGILCGISN